MKKILFLFSFFVIIFSCSKSNDEYIEFSIGMSMDPEYHREAIKIKDDNHVYYCKEIMNLGEQYFEHNTGKYKFYKSINEVDFLNYKKIILENFNRKVPINYHSIEDATTEQIDFKLNNIVLKQNFISDKHLSKKQESVYNEIWMLKDNLKYEQTDSIYFNQELLQEKLPEPPPLEK